MAWGMYATASDPKENTCPWCPNPGVEAVEARKPKGTFLYPCQEHVHLAHQANATAPRK